MLAIQPPPLHSVLALHRQLRQARGARLDERQHAVVCRWPLDAGCVAEGRQQRVETGHDLDGRHSHPRPVAVLVQEAAGADHCQEDESDADGSIGIGVARAQRARTGAAHMA